MQDAKYGVEWGGASSQERSGAKQNFQMLACARYTCHLWLRKILMERLDDGCFDERWRDALGQLMHAFKEKCVKSPADLAARGSLWILAQKCQLGQSMD